MFEFKVVDFDKLNQEEYNAYSKKSVFTTINWIRFVKEDSKATPSIIRVTKDRNFIGYIPMLFVKKFGVKIAGSPFRGWSSCWMGLEVEDEKLKPYIIKELLPYLFDKHGVLYCEIADRYITKNELVTHGFKFNEHETLELRIDKTDQELWKVFKTDCRNFIRQFDRRGAVLEEVEPSDEFAEEYYNELIDVFAKQNMKPTYSCEKVKTLLRNMKGTGNVLCLRVRTPENKPAATSIFFCDKKKFYFWGGASYREHQHYRPNEAMIWHAIQYFRDRGIATFDMVGNRPYKKKFGSEVVTYYTMQFARFKILFKLREIAEKLYYWSLKQGKKSE